MTVANKERVKKAMKSVGINTMTELANEVGITKNQLSLILSNRYSPIKSTFVELSEVLKVTPVVKRNEEKVPRICCCMLY